MNVTELNSDGLKREFKVTVAASDLDSKLMTKLEEVKGQVHLKGFRPGKAPVSFLKKTYGKSFMGEILEQTVSETSQKALDERELRPAMQPKIDFEGDMEDVVAGKIDLTYTMAVEILPDFEVADVNAIKLERMTADVEDTEVDEALKRLAEQQKSYAAKDEGAAAEDGDRLTIDFAGDLDGEPFEGGSAEGAQIVLGAGQFIPGFEEQLVGAKAGEEKDVNVTFPEDYHAENLKGKDAHFKVTVHEVAAPEEVEINDELAKNFGMEDLATLKERLKERIEADYTQMSRVHLKRALLDALDEKHSFELPPGMVEAEFEQIWQQVLKDLEDNGKSIEDEEKSEDELKEEYRKIAERRVRLGLVLSEIGQKNSITVNQEELNRAIADRARQFPGSERQIFELYQQNQFAQQQLRAPIFEDKVVDFILELATITDKKVSKDELFKEPDDELS